jgi:polyvinyl alcohol dehydrogenase (cytochrome)
MVGDMGGFVHMIDATNGKELWSEHMGLFEKSISTGTPVLVGDKVIAPSSQYEIMLAAQDAYECCKIHGGVVALDAMTGKRVWEGHTMEQAKPMKRSRRWSDAVGTGRRARVELAVDRPQAPASLCRHGRGQLGAGAQEHQRASWRSSLKTARSSGPPGDADDVFNVGCGPNGGAEELFEDTVFRDVDFGASTIIAKAPNGKELVVAGQKSGTVWAMNPDTARSSGAATSARADPMAASTGASRLTTRMSMRRSAIPAVRSPDRRSMPHDLKPGLYAVNLKDGSIDWKFEVAPDCTDARKKFVPRCNSLFGLSGAPTVIGDHIITGGLDGRVYMVEKQDRQAGVPSGTRRATSRR